ncbi:MAG: DUF92 domain-containing protein [Calditrichaeota bacterium]|nr:DUF92 domain-containing protein [Calditrichota bacterium]
MDWFWLAVLLVGLGAVIGFSEIVRKKIQWSVKTTRKLVHMLTGIFIALASFLMRNPLPLLLISGAFVVVNLIAIRRGWMPGMHATDRTTYGTVFYPLSFFILTLLLWDGHKSILVLSVLTMAIADAFAAIVGEQVRVPKIYQIAGEQKSFQGSSAMFAMTFLIVLLGLRLLTAALDNFALNWLHAAWYALVVALVATACEALSSKGSDNLSVPLGTAFFMFYLVSHSNQENLALTFGVALALLIAVVSFYLKFLNGSGAVSTFLLGAVVFGVGRWEFSLPLLLFFVLSSILSKVGKQWKARFADTFQKGGRRDIGQVFANGGLAGLLVILWNFFPNDGFYLAFVGSIAAVTADTWGTEIGVFSRIMPRLVTNFRRVPPGTSGGVTLLGFLGGLAGSVVIVYVSKLATARYDGYSFALPMLVAFAGLFGSVVDSVVGATVQAQFKCPQCGKITEKHVHCTNHATVLHSGVAVIDNDAVNGICAFSGAVFAYVVYLAMA